MVVDGGSVDGFGESPVAVCAAAGSLVDVLFTGNAQAGIEFPRIALAQCFAVGFDAFDERLGQIGFCFELFQIGSLAGSLSASFLFARIRHRQWFNLGLSLMMLAGISGLWLMPAGTAPLWILLAGAGTSGCFASALMLFALRSSDSRTAAALSGMAQTVGYSIAAVGPLGMGLLYDVSGSWSASLSVLSVLMLAECVLAWFVARPDIIR